MVARFVGVLVQLFLDKKAFKLVGAAVVGMAKEPAPSYRLEGGLLARGGFDGSGDVSLDATNACRCLH